MPNLAKSQQVWVSAACLLLGACATNPGFGSQRTYAFDNSVSAACRNDPANCTLLTGEPPPAAAPAPAVATAGYTTHVVLEALDELTRTRIEEALEKCADDARSEVLLRYAGQFKGVGPAPEDCRKWVTDATGRRVTWAMRLGLEMHEVALNCAQEALDKLRPGGFSIEPRYHYDAQTGKLRLISPEEERALLESGNTTELLGTLKPDVVIHAGNPLQTQAIYDYKFPCVNTDEIPRWTPYPSGHPYQGLDQGQMYQRALGTNPVRVVPRLGVVR